MSNLYGVDQYFEVIEEYQLNVQFRPTCYEEYGEWRVYRSIKDSKEPADGCGDTLVQAIDAFLLAIEND